MRLAWDFVEHTGRSIFLTGKAGTGKTTFLKTVVERSTKRMVVVAPTGVSAINAGGMTIHSFFQLPLSPFVPEARVRNRFDFSREKRKIISTIDVLIIDEISMVRSDLLDAVDSVLRRFREHDKPFGGVQLLMIGDLGQLTPVVTPDDERMLQPYYDTPYFFGSHALQLMEYVTIQLERVYRQQDTSFLSILNHIREGNPTAADLETLNSRCRADFHPSADEGYIRLTTHNLQAHQYNDSELSRLSSEPVAYQAEIEGTFPEYAYPTSERLVLKVGAQVMFVKNDPSADHRYYNGRIGRVTEAHRGRLLVLCPGDKEAIEVQPMTWENAKYKLNEQTKEIETEVQGTFRQYPLRLAWAITIHKSQGLTFDRAIIDATYSFAPGQVYVALSRCRSLEGLLLASPLAPSAVINDHRVESYIGRQQASARESIAQLPVLKEEYHRHLLLELFSFAEIEQREELLCRTFIEYFHHSYAALTTLHKQTLVDMRTRLTEVAAKWTSRIASLSVEQLHETDFLERISRSASYFEEVLMALFETLLAKSKDVQTQNKTARRRVDAALADLQLAYVSRRNLLQTVAMQGFSVAGYLKAKQEALLDAMGEEGPSAGKKHERKKKEPKPKKEPTQAVTLRMYKMGTMPDLIAKERGLSTGTIYTHLGHFVASGELPIHDFIDADKLRAIQMAMAKAGSNSRSAIKENCPPDVTWDDLTLVLASMKK